MIMATNNIKLLLMKKILIHLELIIGLIAVLTFNGCKEDIDPIVTDLTFSRAFTPLDFNAQIANKTTAEFSWTALKAADHYVLEIYKGSDVTTGTMVQSVNIDGTLVAFSVILQGNTEYAARIKAVSSVEGVGESNWAVISFETLPENLFDGYVTEMTAMHEFTVRWKPGQTVTALVLDNGSSQSTYNLSDAEIAAGQAVFTSVDNAAYKISIMYNTVIRGVTHVLVEGDVLLPAGGDLKATIKSMSPGQVLVLENGATYPLAYADTITASIKIRAIFSDNQPVIYLASAASNQSNHMFDIGASMTSSDSLVFENITLTGYYDNAGVIRHRGFIDEEATAFEIGTIKFKNCTLKDSGRSAIRLRGGSYTQIIHNVIFDGCIMYDYAWDSHYGVLNGAAGGNFYNIVFRNSTLYNLRGGIVNYTAGAGCTSVVVDNCSFNQTMMDASSARYLIDFGTGSNTSAGAITISDCIFGQTSAIANGVRNSLMALTVTGSYYTTDYVNVSGSIIPSMTAYSGASAALWTAPVAGNFTFLDQAFAVKNPAGDPRWRP